jgi:hypothetical protein
MEKQAQKEMDILANQLKPVVETWETAQKTFDAAEIKLNAAIAAQAKAEAALRKSTKTNKYLKPFLSVGRNNKSAIKLKFSTRGMLSLTFGNLLVFLIGLVYVSSIFSFFIVISAFTSMGSIAGIFSLVVLILI